MPNRLTHGLRRWFISTCHNASARTEVVALMTHNAKGEMISDAFQWRRWESNSRQYILMTMSQIPVPDVALELAEVSALHALFRAVARDTEGS